MVQALCRQNGTGPYPGSGSTKVELALPYFAHRTDGQTQVKSPGCRDRAPSSLKIEERGSEPHLWRSIHCRRSHALIENRSRYGDGPVGHRPCSARSRPVWLATWLVAVQLRLVLADACLGFCRGGRR